VVVGKGLLVVGGGLVGGGGGGLVGGGGGGRVVGGGGGLVGGGGGLVGGGDGGLVEPGWVEMVGNCRQDYLHFVLLLFCQQYAAKI